MLNKRKNKNQIANQIEEINEAVTNKIDEVKLETHIAAIKQNLPKVVDNQKKQIKTNYYEALKSLKAWNQEVQFTTKLRNTIDLAISGLNLFLQVTFDRKNKKVNDDDEDKN